MPRILIHASINIRKTLMDYLKEHLREFNRKNKANVVMESAPNNEEENWFLQALENNDIPDLVVAHATDFAPAKDSLIQEHFMKLVNPYPMSQQLQDKAFRDPEGIFHPIMLVPFVIIANNKILKNEEMPLSWKDFIDSKWNDRVVVPDTHTPISLVVTSFLRNSHPGEYEKFASCIGQKPSPVEVLKAVESGEYPIGIANLGFSKMMTRNIQTIIPLEGAVPTPIVLTFSKKADPRLIELAEIFFKDDIQKIFANQGFIPVVEGVEMPKDENGRNIELAWKGWPEYFSAIRKDEVEG
jgi:ABC-type Fe3+ transport system substrate-binding protein